MANKLIIVEEDNFSCGQDTCSGCSKDHCIMANIKTVDGLIERITNMVGVTYISGERVFKDDVIDVIKEYCGITN